MRTKLWVTFAAIAPEEGKMERGSEVKKEGREERKERGREEEKEKEKERGKWKGGMSRNTITFYSLQYIISHTLIITVYTRHLHNG